MQKELAEKKIKKNKSIKINNNPDKNVKIIADKKEEKIKNKDTKSKKLLQLKELENELEKSTSKLSKINIDDDKNNKSEEKIWEKICMRLTQRTAQILFVKQEELKKIKWTDGESNTDSGFSKLACECCEEAFDDIKNEYPEYKEYIIKSVIPDINITICKDKKIITRAKIELKSGKGLGIIPGSTIGSLDINKPVIFCLRNEIENTFDFRYGQYYNCIGETNTDTFQDRTPRPSVNFKKMNNVNTLVSYVHKEKTDWVDHYAECAVFRTKLNKPHKSWQDDLIKKIKILVINDFIKETSIHEFAKLKS